MSAIPKQSLRQHATVGGIATLFALIQSHLISLVFQLSGYRASADTALGVLTGHPYDKLYQSRILGPYIVLWISKITHNYLSAHFVFGFIAITAAGYLSWQMGLRLGGDVKSAVVSFFALQFGFCYLFSPPWLYTWDYLGLVIFFAFLLMVVDQKAWQWFVGLIAVAIFNRESGEFIALWMIIDPLVKASFSRSGVQRRAVNWQMATAGICCLLGGIAIVHFLRVHLLIEESGPNLLPGGHTHQDVENFLFQAKANIEEIRGALRAVHPRFQAPMLIFPLAVLYYSVRLPIREPERWLGVCLVSLAEMAAIFLVGNVLETRVYVELLPFVVLGIVISTIRAAAENESDRVNVSTIR